MAISIVYADWWEAFYKNWTTYQVYGRTSITVPSWDDVETTWEDYFDCTWFTSSTYVFCIVLQVENTGSSSSSVAFRADVRTSDGTVLSTPIKTTATVAAWATKAIKQAIKYSVLSWQWDSFDVRFTATDLDWMHQWYYTFDIYTPPWWIDCYSWIWKWLNYNWANVATFYEEDMDPTITSMTATKTYTPNNTTSTFDLSNCGVWSGVGCFTVYWANTYWTSQSLSSTTLKLQAYKNNSWVDRKSKTFSWSISSWWYRWWYMEFSVLPWEVWTDATNYRVVWTWSAGTDTWNINETFNISNLSIDDTAHDPWYLRVEWSSLCYTDWYGYKHKIETDTISWYVWVDKAWYIRLDENEPLWINYVSAYGSLCKTTKFRQRYWWNTNVWSDKAWFIWVSNGTSASNARYCLCMISPSWNKMRVINHWDS